MSEMYWEQYMTTGSVADYLTYKMEQSSAARGNGMSGRTQAGQAGRKEERESDRTDGHGALHDAGRRI